MADTQHGQISLNMKDVSDWLKILMLLGALITGYVRLSAKVDNHTDQLTEVRTQIDSMRGENRQRNYDLQKKVGAIQMYLCSKDNTHCNADLEPAAP
jgi:hypothetical protein